MGESESIVDNVASGCKEQGIDYYRFSPQLDEVVCIGETDLDEFFRIVLKSGSSAFRKTLESSKGRDNFAMDFSRLVMRFYERSVANRKMAVRMKFALRKTTKKRLCYV